MKKLLTGIIIASTVTAMMLSGCSKTTKTSTAAKTDDSETTTSTAKQKAAISTVGPDSGTKLEMWTFVDLHSQFYASMLKKWNTAHPDKQLQITFTVYPYADMHNKLMMADQTGEGAPDLCDIEIGQFPNFMNGVIPFVEMNKYIDPYRKDIVPARLAVYSKGSTNYGIPTHVGATVMYYNDELLSKYGIDYKTIKTWDDYEAAGKKLDEASNHTVKMTSVDTGGTDWLWLSMAENKTDWTDTNGKADITIPAVADMIKMQQKWLKEGVAMTSPGGQVDMEEGFANIGDEKIASFPKALWFMSRFLNYMPEMKGKFAIAPCPVYKAGQPRSVGIGGTGTIVSTQSKHADLAAEFIAWAKLSKEGNIGIWETLGFDPCNMSLWKDTSITHDTSNKYIQFFKTNPFDVLNSIANEIGAIKVNAISPTINEQINLTVLVNCLEQNADVDSELKAAQQEIDIEQ